MSMMKHNIEVNNSQLRVLCSLDDIPSNGARGYIVNTQSQLYRLIALKTDSGIFLYENRCPHIGTPLDWTPDQFLDESYKLIQCSTHGALFRIEDGYCIFGPCAGQSLREIQYEIRKNQVFISLP